MKIADFTMGILIPNSAIFMLICMDYGFGFPAWFDIIIE